MTLTFGKPEAPRAAFSPPSAAGDPAFVRHAEIVIVGAGLAGTAAASALARAGRDVVLVESTANVPPTLRAEKLDDAIMRLFGRLGLDATVRASATPINSVWIARFGRLMARRFKREYGFSYADLITTLRARLPPDVDFRIARVADVSCGPERQRVTLADGGRIEARLLVVATGHGEAIRRKLGIRMVERQAGHSMCIGFYLKTPRGDLPFESLIYHGERPGDRVAYFSLFPIGARMRANLFVYRTLADAWTKRFRADPSGTLHATLPQLERLSGRLAVDEPIDIRPIDLRVVEGYRRDGVVLIGDAFCTSCPITGTGMRKALTDVDRLCAVHVPDWFATPGMGADKIARFYADAIKAGFDAQSLHASQDLRGVKIGEGRYWRFRRVKNGLKMRMSFALHRGANMTASFFGAILSVL